VLPPSVGPSATTIVGQTLAGMTDAAFIATGQYSGDGTGSAIGFANGPKGWGTLAQEPDGTLTPTGQKSTDNSTPGNEYWMDFVNGTIETVDIGGLPFGPNGEQFPVDRYWRWQGDTFVVDHDNIFTAAPAPDPATDAGQLPSGTCPNTPADGTYSVFWGAQDTYGNTRDSAGPQTVTFTVGEDGPGGGDCTFVVAASTPVDIPVLTSAGATAWITAPAWLLDNSVDSGTGTSVWGQVNGSPLSQWFGGFTTPGASPYYIPPGLDVVSFAPTTPDGVITISGGALTGFAPDSQ
jgi:hypothetical protein